MLMCHNWYSAKYFRIINTVFESAACETFIAFTCAGKSMDSKNSRSSAGPVHRTGNARAMFTLDVEPVRLKRSGMSTSGSRSTYADVQANTHSKTSKRRGWLCLKATQFYFDEIIG